MGGEWDRKECMQIQMVKVQNLKQYDLWAFGHLDLDIV